MQKLDQILDIKYPIIMAPMFLVSNQKMMEAAMDEGIAGCFPSLNFREKGELADLLQELNAYRQDSRSGTYGVNLIAQKTNPLFQKHLEICVSNKVPFYITSLGNPRLVIEGAKSYGGRVFCDVTNMVHAEKVAELGCDAFIAVVKGAGGHAGPLPAEELLAQLKSNFPHIPVIIAGGVATGQQVNKMLELGAAGVSVGTRFIASEEASVSQDYKQAIIDSKREDIVSTTRLSGTPCNIINTDYARKVGLEQSRLEKYLSNHPVTKKYFKMLIQMKGMKKFKQGLQPATYKTLWCAGETVQDIDSVLSTREIVSDLSGKL